MAQTPPLPLVSGSLAQCNALADAGLPGQAQLNVGEASSAKEDGEISRAAGSRDDACCPMRVLRDRKIQLNDRWNVFPNGLNVRSGECSRWAHPVLRRSGAARVPPPSTMDRAATNMFLAIRCLRSLFASWFGSTLCKDVAHSGSAG